MKKRPRKVKSFPSPSRMSFPQVSKSIKALLLGFFCCLGVASANEAPAVKAVPAQLFSLNEVHPQSDRLVPATAEGTTLVPPSYRLCKFPILDEDGKNIGTRSMLVSIRNIVTAEHVQLARLTGRLGENRGLAFRCRRQKGQQCHRQDADGSRSVGRDSRGGGLIAPTVQAQLDRDFIITGLNSKDEVDRVAHAFNAPIKPAQ